MIVMLRNGYEVSFGSGNRKKADIIMHYAFLC